MAYAPDTPNDIKRGKAQVLPDMTVRAPALRRSSFSDLYNQAQIAQADPYGTVQNNLPNSSINDTPVARNIAATVAPQPAPAMPASNVVKPAPQQRSPLARGVSRYTIGGDVGGPNAAQVYTTRGKDGSVIFTDDASYAARNSAGGLRRGDANAQVLANSQIDPNSAYEYAKPTSGLTTRDILNLNSDGTQKAFADASAAAAKNRGTDQGVSDAIQANQLRARMQTQQEQQGAGSGALSPRDQIALFRAQDAAKRGQEMVDVARQNAGLSRTRDARAGYNDTVKNYNSFVANGDNNGAANFLADKLSSLSPKDLKSYLGTPEGKFVRSNYLNILQQGAMNAELPWELIDKRKVPTLTFANLAMDKNGDFSGFNDPTDPAGSDPEYPLRKGLLRRGFGTGENYTPSIYSIPSANLAVLKQFDSGK